jgi:hypothetical protein
MSGTKIIPTGGGWKSGFEGLAKIIPDPMDEMRAAALGTTVAKNQEDILKAQQLQRDNARWREYVGGSNITPQGLVTAAGPNADLLRLVPETNIFLQATRPGATPQDITTAYMGGAKPYGSTPLGWAQGEANQTQRSHIAAGPGYAGVAEQRRQFNQTPTYLIDPATNQVLPPMPRERVNSLGQPMMPASPELYLGLLKPQDYGGPQGNMQMGLGAYTRAFQGRPVPAPTPPTVQAQHDEPIVVSPAPGAPGQYTTKGAVAKSAPPLQQGQPVYQPPPLAQPPAPPAPNKIDYNTALDLDMLAQIELARAAKLPDTYYTGSKDKPSANTLPQQFLDARQAINQRAAELYAGGMEMNLAVSEAMKQYLGDNWGQTPTTTWYGGTGAPVFKPGVPGYQPPQVPRGPTGRVDPPARPRGPTISVTGNPNPQPTPAPTPPPAPTPAQAQPIARAPAGTADGTPMQTPDGRRGVVRGGLLFAE